MAADSNSIEQAVTRTLRDNLEKIQRTAEELHQAVNDLVSACASSRPTNALPSMIRAQTSAASLSATFDILSRFVTGAFQSHAPTALESEILRIPSMAATTLTAPPPDPPPMTLPEPVQPEPTPEHPMVGTAPENASANSGTAPLPEESIQESPAASEMPLASETHAASDRQPPFEMPPTLDYSSGTEPAFPGEPVPVYVYVPEPAAEPVIETAVHSESVPTEAEHVFRLDSLSPEEQELHRRAYRIAKVSMQDIKMLRPEDVRLGRENKDLCSRLRDDIEKAHKEYDRRFQSIQTHPVDYFYTWMVEILAGGDPQALGDYPYPSPVLRH